MSRSIDPAPTFDRIQGALKDLERVHRVRAAILSRVARERKTGGQVILLGMPRPQNDSDPSNTSAFVLRQLLEHSSLKSVMWHDPTSGLLANRGQDHAWGRALAMADCVVLLADHPDYDLPFIRQHASWFLDATGKQELRALASQGKKRGNAPPPQTDDTLAMQIFVTGETPLLWIAQTELTRDLAQRFAWAFFPWSLLMFWVLNPGRTMVRAMRLGNLGSGIQGALLTLLPVTLPIAIVFGIMGWTGMKVDPACLLSACVIPCVMSPFVIRYILEFRSSVQQGHSVHDATREAWGYLASPLGVTCIVGMLVWTAMGLTSLRALMHHGLPIAASLAACAVASLVYLPSLCALGLGRLLGVDRIRRPTNAAVEALTQDPAISAPPSTRPGVRRHPPEITTKSPHFGTDRVRIRRSAKGRSRLS